MLWRLSLVSFVHIHTITKYIHCMYGRSSHYNLMMQNMNEREWTKSAEYILISSITNTHKG